MRVGIGAGLSQRGRALVPSAQPVEPPPASPYLLRRGYQTLEQGTVITRPIGAYYAGSPYPGSRFVFPAGNSRALLYDRSYTGVGYYVIDFYLTLSSRGSININPGTLLENADNDDGSTGNPNTVNLVSGGARDFQIRLNNSTDPLNNVPVYDHETVFCRHIAYANGGVYGEFRLRRLSSATWDFTCVYRTLVSIANYRQRWAAVNRRQAGGATDTVYNMSGLSVYLCPDLTTAQNLPSDLVPPPSPQKWYVSGSATGTGDGTTAGKAWTTSQLATELGYGTVRSAPIPDAWKDQYNSSFPLSGLSTAADHEEWDRNYEVGNRVPQGDGIRFSGLVEVSSQISLENRPGVWVEVPTGSTVTAMRTVSGPFTQPNAGSAPNVWQVLGSDFISAESFNQGGVLYENDQYHQPLYGANLASVLSTLNSTPGSCYADAGGLYFRPRTGNNPNTDGVVRRVARRLPPLGTGPGVIALGTNLLTGGGTVESGAVVGYSQANYVSPQYAISSSTGGLAVIDNVTMKRGSYHNHVLTGNGITGHVGIFDVVHSQMPTLGGAITDTTYTSETATACRIWHGMYDVTVDPLGEFQAPNAAPANNLGQSYYSHSNAGRTNKAFSTLIRRCTFGGELNPSLSNNNEFVVEDSTFQKLGTDVTGTTIRRSTLTTGQCRIFTGGTATLTDCLVVVSGAGVANEGTLVFQSCTVDLTGLSSTNLVTTTAANQLGCAIVTTGKTLSVGSPTLTNTVTGTTTTALGLNAQYLPQAGSSVIGAGTVRTLAPDRTGVVFTTRNEAGCYERVS